MDVFYEIEFDNGTKHRSSGDGSLNLSVGDSCVIRGDFCLDYGKVTKIYPPACIPEEEKENTDKSHPTEEGREKSAPDMRNSEVPRIQRKATLVDLGKANENIMRAKTALRITQKYVDRLALPMKLINAHYSFDGKLITIQFSADGRVDFRELVKQLSREFNTRIELRQIGVRDETAIIGGIAVCGRPLCCCVFLKDFASINVKMAKEQDLSLTPGTISGICGRLKCCLKYEHEGYLELEAGMPRRGDCCECKEGRGRVVDRNLLTGKVMIHLDDSNRFITCPKEEVIVLYPEKYKIQSKNRKTADNTQASSPLTDKNNSARAPRGNGGNGRNTVPPSPNGEDANGKDS